MSAPTLTICVPTLGRLPGLRHTLDSIARQALIPGDRVLVVLDSFEQGSRPDIRALVEGYGTPFEYYEHDGGTHWYGVSQFNYAMALVTTDFFCGLGDDDVYVDGAIARLRPQLQPGRAALVQFLSPPFGDPGQRFVLWNEPILEVAHISGCCLIAPTACLTLIGHDQRREVDYDWIVSVVARTGQEPIWVRDVSIIARPRLVNGEPVRQLQDMSPRAGLKVLLVEPGANSSTSDVSTGLSYGLAQHGVEIVRYRLDQRIARSHRWLHANWRRTKKTNPSLERPTTADVFYQAGCEAVLMALRHQVDVVLVVSAMFLHPDVIIMMKRAGLRVVVLFTESPYDHAHEIAIAKLVDGCWTNERTVVPAFRAVNKHAGYLPHGWHPERHQAGPQPGDDTVPAHDVVFVGSAFQERIAWLSDIDWTGIDLGLYGNWDNLGSRHKLRSSVRCGVIDNRQTAMLYRRAKIGLNLYRTSRGWGKDAQPIAHAESLNPRAYELARCGAFSISSWRAEVDEVFGDLMPTFSSSADVSGLNRLIRGWLADANARERVQQLLPATVAESSWVERAARVIGDLQTLLQRRAA